MNNNSYIKRLSKSYADKANPENAVAMAAYMKNRFTFFGIKTPERRKISSTFIKKNGIPDFNDLNELIFTLFDLPEREFHHFAVEICAKLKHDWNEETIHIFEKMAVTQSWWDSVDSINIFCIKPYFAKFPENPGSISQTWINSNNMWLQRLSIIFQLRLTDKTNTKLLKRNILQLKDSDEFFIQKAIGWALRDYWRTDPQWVIEFVKAVDLKPLSKREALKHL